ncbi:hypothetical protein PGT21_033739 [Puccinia graminis f. sp. tritici]|uniref:Uncharacterized protein n=1 Tax=Puccinia graminis f. sp. tritici TaxID=56615 RepID=A0A5B0NEB7_PUCGR|nr:hypothetical protein PGT21_033739 [Puccinia graminis f. sp. tritici]
MPSWNPAACSRADRRSGWEENRVLFVSPPSRELPHCILLAQGGKMGFNVENGLIFSVIYTKIENK